MAPLKVLELFSGIGGLAAAVDGHAEVVGAVDHDLRAQAVYADNWPHPRHVKNLVSVRSEWLAAFEADLWWMSPPCTPHGIRGKQADLDDPRAASFVALMAHLREVRPAHVALENVPWFHGSRAWELWCETLSAAGYAHHTWAELCPSDLGWPNTRRRLYAVASRTTPLTLPPLDARRRSLAGFLDPWDEALRVPAARQERFGDAFHLVDADDPDAHTATFTKAYGKSPVYAGSYLRQHDGVTPSIRHFSPTEIARIQGFPRQFSMWGVHPKVGWKLIGNSVSVPVVSHVLSALWGAGGAQG